MKKVVLWTLGGLIVAGAIVLGIVYAVRSYEVKRILHMVFVDRLKGMSYSKTDYDGIDVSKNNGVIRWQEVAQNKHIKFVFIKATEGRGYVDPMYRKNIREARRVGLKVGSYHFFTSKTSAVMQFQHFKSVVRKSEQDLIPVLDVEDKGIRGRWTNQQLVDSVKVFADLVKKFYGKYPIIYSNERFYNNDMAHQFNRYYLFIANYNGTPVVGGKAKINLWQYTERGHIRGIGEYVDLTRLMGKTKVEQLML